MLPASLLTDSVKAWGTEVASGNKHNKIHINGK